MTCDKGASCTGLSLSGCKSPGRLCIEEGSLNEGSFARKGVSSVAMVQLTSASAVTEPASGKTDIPGYCRPRSSASW